MRPVLSLTEVKVFNPAQSLLLVQRNKTSVNAQRTKDVQNIPNYGHIVHDGPTRHTVGLVLVNYQVHLLRQSTGFHNVTQQRHGTPVFLL